MNDNDLREMFRRREFDVTTPSVSPSSLARRTRRRQLLTAGAGGTIALIVVLGSMAGLRSLGSSDGSQPGDIGPTTTKTISGITITYPERWFAEDPVAIGIEPNDTPRTLPSIALALTRDDPRIEGVLGCPGLANTPAGGLVMTVQEMPLALSGEGSQPWPIPLQTMDLGTTGPGGCYGGWTFMRASWTTSGRSFEGRVGFAADASDTDRDALTAAYASMTFAPGSVSTQSKAEVATGVTDSGATWSITASRTGDLCWDLEVETDNGGYGTGGCKGDGQDFDTPNMTSMRVDPATTTFIAGTIPGDAVIVSVASPDGIDDASLYPAPSDGWGAVRFMVFQVHDTSAHGSVTVRFRDMNGANLYPPQEIEW